jgi:hypothetical protein
VLVTVQMVLPLFRDGAWMILNAAITPIKGMEVFSIYNVNKAVVDPQGYQKVLLEVSLRRDTMWRWA